MDGTPAPEYAHLDFFPRLFERLRQIPGYTWDEEESCHSSYDNWQVSGVKHTRQGLVNGVPSKSAIPPQRHSPLPGASNTSRVRAAASDSGSDSADEGNDTTEIPVVARVSSHTLREERAFHICKSLTKSVDPEGEHVVRPVDIFRLSSQQGDKGPVVVCIYEASGSNYLKRVVDYGLAWYKAKNVGQKHEVVRSEFTPQEIVPLRTFLDFAVGATECLEILHNGQRIVHGEIRGDAFHMNAETGAVRLLNLGSGLRTFEHGLTTTGWSTLSREKGVKTKLSYMSPEQTGRMPAEPDSRTDIYALGILFWTMLTQQPAFDGETPMDIIQGVLGRRLPLVSTIRLDIPDVIGRIVQKMTAKIIGERYHSASGLRHDLIEVRRLLGAGDSAALKNWQIATHDVSSFFILPNIMVGRSTEHDEVVKMIDKVSRRHSANQSQEVYSLSSGSSLSEGRLVAFDAALDGSVSVSSDENVSSFEGRSNSFHAATVLSGLSNSAEPRSTKIISTLRSGSGSYRTSAEGGDVSTRSGSASRNIWEKNNKSLSLDNRSTTDSSNSDNQATRPGSDGVGSLATNQNSRKFRRKGRCEVVTISGAAGLGKSCLIHSVQLETRRRGYFASSKFDHAKKTPYGPVLKLLSSLFKQVFSESNTDTPFHQILKQYVRPAWPMLHKVLGLPEFLLGAMAPAASRSGHSSQLSQSYNKGLSAGVGRRDSSPSSSHGSMFNVALGAQSSQDFLRAGSSTKSVRLMNTFMDVLRVFTQHKFICFCLDDLQFADDESLDLITQIISARTKMILIMTYRPDEILPERIAGIINPPNTEGIKYIKADGVGITRISLRPLNEDDILHYVAATLCCKQSDIVPLAAVIQSKTAGNPFYMREMLDACHRKQCIWYDYKENGWRYDLDSIFKHFETRSYHDTLDNEFVTSRLNELPIASRSVLAWASLIGSSFSFAFIQKLLEGEFDYRDEEEVHPEGRQPLPMSHTEQDGIEGLQAAVQAYIIIATQDDDRFRFAHDRFIQASASLREQNVAKMHFIIGQTLLKYYSSDPQSRDLTASHVCESIKVIKRRVVHRQSFRTLLFDGAQSAAESGARPTAAKFYAHCLALLQPNPWTEGAPDVYYNETLSLFTRAAECYLYMGQHQEAKRLLAILFANARTPVDKAPAWVLQSRAYAQEGDTAAAFRALKQCLAALDIHVDESPTFEKCDTEFERITLKIQSHDIEELASKNMARDSNVAAVGAVLAETVSTAYWTDTLTFYHMALVMVNTQLTCGNFPQAGIAYLHLAMIAVTRFKMIKFASDMGNISLTLMDRWRDPYTMGRGGTMYSLFVGHLQYSLSDSLDQLEGALEYAIQAGDRISTILNFGLMANLKFFASEHMAELESYCTYGCEEIPNWQVDPRGGTMALAIRQTSRALQGKTFFSDPNAILSDESHDSQLYKTWLRRSVKNGDRSLFFYEGIEICPLFLYGHLQAAIDIGNSCLKVVNKVWSARNTRFVMIFHSLSVAGLMWKKLQDPLRKVSKRNSGHQLSATTYMATDEDLRKEIEDALNLIKTSKRKIEDWQVVNDANYLHWSKLLAAQVAELEGDHGAALTFYEESLNHSAAQNFTFEEALGNYLLSGFFLRVGSSRTAKSTLKESITLYRQIGATGVAAHIESEHSLLLEVPTRNLRTADVGVQTDFAGDSAPVQYQVMDSGGGEDRQQTRASITESKGDRIGAWQGGSARNAAGSGLPALDMLDLTSILEGSQVISSVLQIDQLLQTMCEIILQNCGGLATLAAIVVEEEDPVGWSIAASGNPEHGAQAHIPGLPLGETGLVAEGVILYSTRFRETVFIPDLVHDERFSNVNEAWSARNPLGKSVIALPICHGNKPLLGVLYLEGEPNAFTDRNLTVLQLLVNQIGISYSNALTLKEVEKVSAFNNSMVELQRRALTKALDAEVKANAARAEALRNVKLAEEAAKAKSIFLANVSHELRTPLNGVIGNSELLIGSDLRADQYALADSIRISADLLLTVINDILDFSKMEADKMKLFIVAFNPDEMIREVVRSVSYSNRDKKSSKNVEILQDINLPQSLIFGDPVRLHQVLGNLIGNSLKFTENGTITVGAKTEWETQEAIRLMFWVKDTGIGIPPQQLVKLFKPFSQADASTARKYGGSGLGLSICKSIIESMMGGTIQLESVESEGTTAWFSVTFPKASSGAAAGDSQEKNEDASGSGEVEGYFNDFSTIPREQLRICVAEDNPINQKIAIQFMAKLGFQNVDAYDNGMVAVEGLRSMAKEGKPYHIVLMDVQMPVLDGYEATKLLRKDPLDDVRGVLVIAMTASAIQGDREKCLESGMNDYLAKPVRSGVLKKKLEQYLRQTPIATPNLQAQGKKIANDVLNNANGDSFGSMQLDTAENKPPEPPTTPTPGSSTSQSRAPDMENVPQSLDLNNTTNHRNNLSDDRRKKSSVNTQVVTLRRLSEDNLSPTTIPVEMMSSSRGIPERVPIPDDHHIDSNPDLRDTNFSNLAAVTTDLNNNTMKTREIPVASHKRKEKTKRTSEN